MPSDHEEAMRQSKFLTAAINTLASEVGRSSEQSAEDLVFRRAGLATRADLNAMEIRLGAIIEAGLTDARITANTRALEISTGQLAAAVERNKQN